MKLFLAVEALLFGGLFGAYALFRANATEWPHHVLTLGPGMANTVVLAAAAILAARARRAAATGPPIVSARRQLAYSAFLGALFVALKATEYLSKLNHGIEPSSGTFFALYFLLTGVHALHVLAGAGVAGYLAAAGATATMGNIPCFAGRVRRLAQFWYFVNLVWIGILVLFYLS